MVPSNRAYTTLREPLEAVRIEMDALTAHRTQMEARVAELTRKAAAQETALQKLRKQVTERQLIRRQVADNIKYREQKTEVARLAEQIAASERQLQLGDVSKLGSKLSALEKSHQEKLVKKAKWQGATALLQSQVRTNEAELAKPTLANAEEEHRKLNIQCQVRTPRTHVSRISFPP